MFKYKTLFAEIHRCHRKLDERGDKRLDAQFAPATKADVKMVEARLRCKLPPSYREFVLTVNGCAKLELSHGGLWPISQINWFRHLNAEWIAAYNTVGDLDEDVTKQEHRFNLDNSACFRRAYLPELLQIGEEFDGSVYLLNPLVTTPNGEWEAWSFANWSGAYRKRSFFELVLSTRNELKREVKLRSTSFDEADLMAKVVPVLQGYIDRGVPPSEAVSSFLSDRSQYNDEFEAWMWTTQPYYALLEALGYDPQTMRRRKKRSR